MSIRRARPTFSAPVCVCVCVCERERERERERESEREREGERARERERDRERERQSERANKREREREQNLWAREHRLQAMEGRVEREVGPCLCLEHETVRRRGWYKLLDAPVLTLDCLRRSLPTGIERVFFFEESERVCVRERESERE